MREAGFMTVVAAGVLALGVGTATAATTEYKTIFTKFKYVADSSDSDFKGTIDSTKGKCVDKRKVKLIREKNGDKKTLGSAKTNSNGKFEIDLGGGSPKKGTYYAKATEKDFDGGDKVCLKKTSPSVKVS